MSWWYSNSGGVYHLLANMSKWRNENKSSKGRFFSSSSYIQSRRQVSTLTFPWWRFLFLIWVLRKIVFPGSGSVYLQTTQRSTVHGNETVLFICFMKYSKFRYLNQYLFSVSYLWWFVWGFVHSSFFSRHCRFYLLFHKLTTHLFIFFLNLCQYL